MYDVMSSSRLEIYVSDTLLDVDTLVVSLSRCICVRKGQKGIINQSMWWAVMTVIPKSIVSRRCIVSIVMLV